MLAPITKPKSYQPPLFTTSYTATESLNREMIKANGAMMPCQSPIQKPAGSPSMQAETSTVVALQAESRSTMADKDNRRTVDLFIVGKGWMGIQLHDRICHVEGTYLMHFVTLIDLPTETQVEHPAVIYITPKKASEPNIPNEKGYSSRSSGIVRQCGPPLSVRISLDDITCRCELSLRL